MMDSKWSEPAELSVMDVSFGPKDGMKSVLPTWIEIPEAFKMNNGDGDGAIAKRYVKIVNDIFFCGVKILSVEMKNGINKNKAMMHIQCVLHSFDPSHEHKTAGAAYLMSLWFESFIYEKGKRDDE